MNQHDSKCATHVGGERIDRKKKLLHIFMLLQQMESVSWPMNDGDVRLYSIGDGVSPFDNMRRGACPVSV